MTLLEDAIGGDGLKVPDRAAPMIFENHEEMVTWLTREADHWNLLSRTADRAPYKGTVFHTVFADQTNDFRSAISQLGTAREANNPHGNNARNNLNQFLTRVSEGSIPLSESRAGKLVFGIADLEEQVNELEPDTPLYEVQGDLKAAAGLLMLRREKGLPVIVARNNMRDVMPEIAAVLKGWERSQSIQDVLSAEEASFGGLRDRLEAEYRERVEAIQAEVAELSGKVTAIGEEIEAEKSAFATEMEHRQEAMASYEETLRTKLATESAVKLWSDAAAAHAGRAKIALTCFLGLGAAGVVALFLSLDWITTHIAAQPSLGGLTAVSLPALALAWAMRLASRVFVQSGNAQRDAEIRKAQAETFLSLAADEKLGVSDAERILILNALFRPPGAGADDDAPPPNLIELLTRQTRGHG